MKKIFLKIKGIHCIHCVESITNALLKQKNVKKVEIDHDIAIVSYEDSVQINELVEIIQKLGYEVSNTSDKIESLKNKVSIKEFFIIFSFIILFLFLLQKIFGFNVFNAIPTIDSNVTYGMLFIIGLFTSIHCVSMCGAINLLAVMGTSNHSGMKRPLLYNTGRVLSYTLIGGIIGGIGTVFSIHPVIMGTVLILSSILMLWMSLQMLGIIKVRKFCWFRKKGKSRNPFVIGLLNGLMPCGPLQAMQLYALSTGSILKGAFSMFLFGIGTVPLMFLSGFILNVVKGNGRILLNKIASVLILILSIVMLNRGLLSFGIHITVPQKNDYISSTIMEKEQVVEFTLSYDHYADIIVKNNIPVKLIIHVSEEQLTGCNNEIVFPEFHIQKELVVGDNIIEFTPTKTGDYLYNCWMNMIVGNIKVIEEEK